MARYRSKDETDLIWNRTRRQITRELDTRIQNFREKLLDRMLTAAWEKFSASLEAGTVIELEEDATQWVDAILSKQLGPANGDLENR